MAATAWLFAGHGSQYPGMGRSFAFEQPAVRALFDRAGAITGIELQRASLEADAAALREPALLEPLLAAFALACAALLQARGERAAAVLGYSAGLLPALCCAGVIDVDAVFILAQRRGQVLQAARCAGAMGSAVGLDIGQLSAALSPWPAAVQVAGWNAPDHFTLVADAPSLQRAAARVRAAGAHWLPVPVAGAWHSVRAAGVAQAAATLADDISFGPPKLPLYCSVSGQREHDPERLRRCLAQQLAAPVLWQAAVSALCAGEGVMRFVEVGRGRTLQGMTRRAAAGLSFAPVLAPTTAGLPSASG